MGVCLVFNVGSSSLKWTALDAEERTLGEGSEPLAQPTRQVLRELVQRIVQQSPRPSVVGHRIVHGGNVFQSSVRIDAAARRALDELIALDELHMRPAVTLLDAALEALPDVPQVAAFDTAFHRTLSPAAAGYGLPHEWSERWGLRRYGFHGLSVEWSVLRAGATWGTVPKRLLVAHLGSGCSVTAVKSGASVDTTMGFTPLDGLMMGTRPGAVDPGLLLYLQLNCGLDAARLRTALSHEAGLLGVSGVSGDIRKVIAAADDGHELAQLAYDRFILYGRRALGAMGGSLGGVDALVFTGGIGEHSARVRSDLVLAFGAGLLDANRNAAPAIGDGASGLDAVEIGAGALRALVVAAREDRVIARDARQLVGS